MASSSGGAGLPAGTPGQPPSATTSSQPWAYKAGTRQWNTTPQDRFNSVINPNIASGPDASSSAGPAGQPIWNLPDVRPEDDLSNVPAILTRASTGDYVGLWITDFVSSFQITGTTAQSQGYREFYPRAFNQPRITVVGNCANDFQYNRLAEFVHVTQVEYLLTNNFYDKPPLQLVLWKQPKKNISDVVPAGGQTQIDATIPDRGHIGWLMMGYIEKIQAGGQKFNQAPQFEFEFVVIFNASTQGSVALYSDVVPQATSHQILSWMDVIKSAAFDPKSSTPSPGTIANQVAGGVAQTLTGVIQGLGGF